MSTNEAKQTLIDYLENKRNALIFEMRHSEAYQCQLWINFIKRSKDRAAIRQMMFEYRKVVPTQPSLF